MNKVKNTKRKHSILDFFSFSKENNYKLSIQFLNKIRKSRKNQCAFTLVELIVGIIILAILGTIAFISLQGYSSQSRDSTRISDIFTMKEGLDLFNLDAGKYPLPSDGTEITYSGVLAWTQGYFGKEVVINLDKLNKIPVDPLTKKEYVYSTTNTRGEYQIAIVMEGDNVSYNKHTNSIFRGDKRAQASEKKALVKISGTYNGKVLKVSTGLTGYILALPSIISSSGVTLELITANHLLAYNGYKNLPFQYEGNYKTDGEADLSLVNQEKLVVYQGEIKTLSDTTSIGQVARANLLTNLQIAYSNTSISSIGEIAEILNTTSPNEVAKLATTIVSNNLGGSIVAGTTINETKTVYGDENVEAIGACNKWVENAVGSNAGGFQNWIWVPARNFTTDGHGTALINDFYKRVIAYNGINYICNGFAVMKYEAKFSDTNDKSQSLEIDYRKTWRVSDYETDNDLYPLSLTGGIVSKAGDFPIAYIRQGEAIQACGGLTYSGAVSHLITNNEWMAITRNVESQAVNWSNGVIGSGGIFRGNVNLKDSLSYSSYGAVMSRTQAAGIDSDIRGTNKIGNRRLLLSNNQNIWDLSGNVWEHVNKSNVPTTSNIRTSNSGWNTNTYSTEAMCNNGTWNRYGWYGTDLQNISACTMINGYTQSSYGPLNNLNADNGIGRIYTTNVQDRDNIFLRGGRGNYGANSGLFTLYLSGRATTRDSDVGFRCGF